MKKTTLFIFLIINSFAWSQTGAINIDFETADFTGWQLSSGTNTNSTQPFTNTVTAISGTLNVSTTNCSITAVHSIMTATADPISSVSLTSPLGGNYVARINRHCANMVGSNLTQTFLVDNTNCTLYIAYLAVLESPSSHWITDQSFFSYEVLDQSGNMIPNSSYSTIDPSMTFAGFISAPPNSDFYKPWTSDTIDLSTYIGQNVTVKFSAAGCPQGAHSGYAYVDAQTTSIVTSIEQKQKELFNLFPNPVSGTLKIALLSNEIVDFEIMNLLGQVIIKEQNSKVQQIDVSQLQKGTYFLKAYLNESMVIRKFIKQ